MIPFQTGESNPLVVKGAQAKQQTPIESDPTTPLKKKPTVAMLEDPFANTYAPGVGSSTPLRTKK